MKEVGVWQVVDGIWLCFFKFIGGEAYRKGEVQYPMPIYFFVGYNETPLDLLVVMPL